MPKRERGFEEKTSSGHAGQGPIAMPKRERVSRQVYQWGPTQNSPGGTPFQTGVVGNQKLIRKAKTTPGGKTKVLHQFCAEGCTDPCTEDKVCRSCHRKKAKLIEMLGEENLQTKIFLVTVTKPNEKELMAVRKKRSKRIMLDIMLKTKIKSTIPAEKNTRPSSLKVISLRLKEERSI